MNWAWNAVGFAFVGLGMVGAVVPGMPTTVFLILALGCFGKAGNKKLRAWLLGLPKFGKILEEWERDRTIPLWVKWVSCGCIVFFSGLSILVIPVAWVKGLVAAIAIAGVAYILSKKTKVDQAAVESDSVDAKSLDLAS